MDGKNRSATGEKFIPALTDEAFFLKTGKLNVDDNPRSAQLYDASSIPTLVMVRNGQVVDRVIGAQPEPVLAAKIDQHLSATA